MRLFFIAYIVLASISTGLAQRYVSSYDDADTSKPPSPDRVNELNILAFKIRESDPSTSLQYSQDAYQLASQLNDKIGMARALSNSGWIYYRRGDFARALEDSFESLQLCEITGDQEELARVLNNIGAIYFEQRQFAASIAQFRRAFDIGLTLRDTVSMTRSLNNIAFASLQAGLNLDSAIALNRRALAFSQKIDNKYLISFCHRVNGEINEVKGNLHSALNQYMEAHYYGALSNTLAIKVATNYRIGRVYLKLGKIDEALAVLLANAKDAEQFGFRDELEKSYKLIADAYQRKNNLKLAYEYLNKHLTLHDSIFNEQNTAKLASLKSKFEADIRQTQIELLTKDSALKQEEISRQRMQLYVVVGGWSFVCIIAVILLISFRKAKKAKEKLQLQKEELAQKNSLIEEKSSELTRLNATKDKLFSIIGHDFRSPLQSLKGLLELISRGNLSQQEFNLYSGELKNRIDLVYANLNNLLNWSVLQLQGIQTKPITLRITDVVEDVVSMYADISQRKGIELRNLVARHIFAYADRDHLHLVLRNLVSNAIKFTSSGSVTIYASCTDDDVEVHVEDSGTGIAEHDLERLFNRQSLWTLKGTNNEKGLGLGLLLCREFVEKNNGMLKVKSTINEGTTFTFSLRRSTFPVDLAAAKSPKVFMPARN